MQRTGRNANILSKPSNERNSAGLNFTESQRGHFRRIPSRWGIHAGHSRLTLFMVSAFLIMQLESQGLSVRPAMTGSNVCWP